MEHLVATSRRAACVAVALALAAAAPARAGEGVGDLYVQSEPPGVRIELDGQDTGQVTPALLRGLPAGEHALRLEAGCRGAAQRVVVQPVVVTRSELSLRPGAGRLEVVSDPPGAQVKLDGVERGTAPLTLPEVACGEHRLELSLAGHRPYAETFQLASDVLRTASVTLEAIARGTLVVVPEPLDAAIWLDGALVGQGAMTLEGIEVGRHDVELRAAGLTPQARTLEVTSGEVTRLELSLVRQPVPVGDGPGARVGRLVGRRVLGTALIGVGAGLAAHGGLTWARTAQAYDDYLAFDTVREAEAFYDEHVAPGRVVFAVDLTAALLLLGGGSALWIRPADLRAPAQGSEP